MDEFHLAALDIGVILFCLLMVAVGVITGFVKAIMIVGTWLGAIFITLLALPHVQPFFREHIEGSTVADIVAGAVIFLIALILLFVITSVISRRVQESRFLLLDRVGGGLAGLAIGWFVVVLAYLPIDFVWKQEDQPEWFRNAWMAPYIRVSAQDLTGLVSDNVPADALPGDVGDLSSPPPTTPEPEAEDPTGYSGTERQGMDRLGETVQPR